MSTAQKTTTNFDGPLVEVPVVRFITGLRRDEIYERVDGRTLLGRGLIWVFNVSVNPAGDIRDLRFWIKEVEGLKFDSDATSSLHIDHAINRILPISRHNFHSGEILKMFSLSRPTLAALRDELNGNLIGARNVLFTRQDVATFLKNRWLGNGGARVPASRDSQLSTKNSQPS